MALPLWGHRRSCHSQPDLPAQHDALQQPVAVKEAVDVSEDTKAISSEMVFKETYFCIAELAKFKARKQH